VRATLATSDPFSIPRDQDDSVHKMPGGDRTPRFAISSFYLTNYCCYEIFAIGGSGLSGYRRDRRAIWVPITGEAAGALLFFFGDGAEKPGFLRSKS
jgi:hypothetical protein